MAQGEEKVVIKEEEDEVDDIVMVDDHGNSGAVLGRDGMAKGPVARGPARIDSLERELTRVVRMHGKWMNTQVETYQKQLAAANGAKKQLAAQVTELKAALASKEAGLLVAQSDLERLQKDLQLAKSTPINGKLQAEVTRLRGELHHERLQRREEEREFREAREEATPMLGGVGSVTGPTRDPRLNRSDRARGGPNNRRGAPRGRIDKR